MFPINQALIEHYFRHFKTGVFVSMPFLWDAIQKFQASGHQLRFDRMTLLGVLAVAVIPAIQALYGRYVKKYPHLQPELQFASDEATKFLEAQLAVQAPVASEPVQVPSVETAPVPIG